MGIRYGDYLRPKWQDVANETTALSGLKFNQWFPKNFNESTELEQSDRPSCQPSETLRTTPGKATH